MAAALERRLFDVRREFVALSCGDPLLAVSVALGTWLMRGRVPSGPAGLPFGLASLAGALSFGLLQWRAEVRRGFYTWAQALSPTKIWHQLAVYPVLGYWVWTADVGGLVVPGPAVAKAAIVGCVAAWLLANAYDRRHPKLGHPPYDWLRLRPQPPPWPAQSVSLRAYLAGRSP